MTSTVSAWRGVSESRSSISSSAKPWTEVSGLRSSWEAVRTNSSLSRSSSFAPALLLLELLGHLVEGGAEGRGLRQAADLDPGAAVAGGEPPGGVDQLLERPPHRGDQAAEEEQRAGQAGEQPGGDEQRRVAGVAGDFVLQFGRDARSVRSTDRARCLAAGAAGDPFPRHHLHLVGAGDRVLEVLALLDEAADADHRHRGEHGKADREPDPQPVGERRAQPSIGS